MRKDFLRGYLIALIGEGVVSPMDPPTAMFKKVADAVRSDLAVVGVEVASMAAAHGVRKLGDMVGGVLKEKLSGLAQDIAQKGFKSVFDDIKAQYNRGVAANAKRRK